MNYLRLFEGRDRSQLGNYLNANRNTLPLSHEPARNKANGQYQVYKEHNNNIILPSMSTQHSMVYSLCVLDSLLLAVLVPRLSNPTKALVFNLIF